jgi:hypothetical protein
MDNLVKKAIPFIFAFIVFILLLTILNYAGVGKFPAQGISLVVAYLVQNFFQKKYYLLKMNHMLILQISLFQTKVEFSQYIMI